MADDSGEIVREAAEAVSFTNVKTLGEAASYYTAAGMAEHIANTQAMNVIRAGVVTRGSDLLLGGPEDRAIDVGLAQVASKAAGNTPPVTP